MKGHNGQSKRRQGFGRLARISAIAAASVVGSGCYTYSPISHDLAPVGEQVRVVVTRAGAGALADEMQLDAAAPVLLGEITGREPGVMLLRVRRQSDLSMGLSAVELAQIARVPVDAVLSVESRELSTGRTAAVIGAAVGATTLLVLGIMEASGSNSGGGGDDVVFAVSGLRIPFPFR